MKRIVGLYLGAVLAAGARAAELAEVSEEALYELGSTYGAPQLHGFVFIEGRYIPPPYTVTRKGNAIFINRIQVEQPVPWGRGVAPADGAPGTAAAAAPAAKKSVDADGDFEEVAPAAEAAAPAAPAPAAEPAKPKTVKSIDDLFDDEEPAAPAAPAPQAVPAAGPAPAPLPAAAAGGGATERSSEEVKRDKEALIAHLDRIRKGYEQSLARGDMFFFGQRHNRVNGNYGTARTLMGVLPKALRNAQSPQDLLQRLNAGGVYFIDLGICAELYRNKMTFPQLEERLAKIEQNEAMEAQRRKAATAW